MKIKINKEFFLNFFISIAVLALVFFTPNDFSTLKLLGIYNIVFSIFIIIRHYNNKSCALLIGIISLINISYSSSVCINTIENVRTWQFALYRLAENVINVKSYCLFNTFLLLSFEKYNNEFKFEVSNYNPMIYFCCFIVLIYALLFGIDRSASSLYVSNTNVLYEYAIVVYVLTWFFSGKIKTNKVPLLLYGILYCIQGLLYGDRSSAFPMIIVNLILLFNDKIDMKKVLIIGLFGILFGNFIEIYRNNSMITKDTFVEIANRGLNVNTISYSSYAGTQIVRYSEKLSSSEKANHFVMYNISLIKGDTSKLALTTLAKEYGLENKGGGFTSNYFYFWFGYLGSIIGGILIGWIINSIYKKKKNQLFNLIQILINAFSIRWVLYYPSAFFRTCIIIPVLGYVSFKVITNMINKRPIFSKIIN